VPAQIGGINEACAETPTLFVPAQIDMLSNTTARGHANFKARGEN